MCDMSLKDIDAWLEKEIEAIDVARGQAHDKGQTSIGAELIKARARLVAKLADVRVTNATIR